jgi:hypothetical protein
MVSPSGTIRGLAGGRSKLMYLKDVFSAAAINGAPHLTIEPGLQGVARVRERMRLVIPAFCARRSVKQAAEKLYNPTAPHV